MPALPIHSKTDLPINTTRADIATFSIPETLAILQVNPQFGLAQREVELRLQRQGSNEVLEQRVYPPLRFLRKFWGLSAWILELIMVLLFVMRYYFGFAIVGALPLVNAVLGFVQEQRAAGAIQALHRRLYISVRVLRDTTWKMIPARELVPGDSVGVRRGDIVPADVRVLTGALNIDLSTLTGESNDVDKGGRSPLIRSRRSSRRGQWDCDPDGSKDIFCTHNSIRSCSRDRLTTEMHFNSQRVVAEQ